MKQTHLPEVFFLAFHTVQPNDTWPSLSARYGCPICLLLRANNGYDSLLDGRVLHIPSPSFCHTQQQPAQPRRHRYAKGETLLWIALRHHVTALSILQENHLLSAGQLQPGMLLLIPAPPEGTKIVTAQAMDTLEQIARAHDMTPQSLCSLNRLPEGTQVHPGMQLYVRDARASMGCKYCPV